jgi:hypothetical protein
MVVHFVINAISLWVVFLKGSSWPKFEAYMAHVEVG